MRAVGTCAGDGVSVRIFTVGCLVFPGATGLCRVSQNITRGVGKGCGGSGWRLAPLTPGPSPSCDCVAGRGGMAACNVGAEQAPPDCLTRYPSIPRPLPPRKRREGEKVASMTRPYFLLPTPYSLFPIPPQRTSPLAPLRKRRGENAGS